MTVLGPGADHDSCSLNDSTPQKADPCMHCRCHSTHGLHARLQRIAQLSQLQQSLQGRLRPCDRGDTPYAEAGSFHQLPSPLLAQQLTKGAQVSHAQLPICRLQQIRQHVLPAMAHLSTCQCHVSDKCADDWLDGAPALHQAWDANLRESTICGR